MAKFSLANPPALQIVDFRNVFVRLPDGRVWFDYLNGSFYDSYDGYPTWSDVKRVLLSPLPESYGPQRFIAGSNWVAATTERVYYGGSDAPSSKYPYSGGYLDTVAIKADGTLWVSDPSGQDKWTGDAMHQFGDETSWRQLAQSGVGVVLLKNDGTLWRWGAISNAWQNDWLHDWPGLRTFTPHQIGTNSDWQDIFTWYRNVYTRQTNGSMWFLERNSRAARDEFHLETNFDEIVPKTTSWLSDLQTAFVQTNGTLWVLNRYWDEKDRRTKGTGVLQVGKENDWQAVAVCWGMMVALKTDGSLWQWYYQDGSPVKIVNASPSPLGIHSDWVAVASTWNCVLALAGDGSLWLWPDKQNREPTMLLQFPKQPKFLGNVLNQTDWTVGAQSLSHAAPTGQ
jgi:alpha-tubulin suppressor-like RCC1 family protein